LITAEIVAGTPTYITGGRLSETAWAPAISGVCPGDVDPVKALEFGVYTALKRKEPGAGVHAMFAEDRPGVLVGCSVPVADTGEEFFDSIPGCHPGFAHLILLTT
jgi:hypothetical protein